MTRKKIIMVTKAKVRSDRFIRESDLEAWAKTGNPKPSVNDVDPVELDEGTRFEMHAGNIPQAEAEQVALQNLSMVPDYYTKLRRARRAARDAAIRANYLQMDARMDKP